MSSVGSLGDRRLLFSALPEVFGSLGNGVDLYFLNPFPPFLLFFSRYILAFQNSNERDVFHATFSVLLRDPYALMEDILTVLSFLVALSPWEAFLPECSQQTLGLKVRFPPCRSPRS